MVDSPGGRPRAAYHKVQFPFETGQEVWGRGVGVEDVPGGRAAPRESVLAEGRGGGVACVRVEVHGERHGGRNAELM